jgi:methyl-accepting chemotaxis protein
MFLTALPIRQRILLCCALPLVALTIVSSFTLVETWKDAQSGRNMAMLLHKAEVLGTVIHELQRERGASAGFISSSGSNFADVLPQQRQATDAGYAAVDTMLADMSDAIAQVFAGHVATLSQDEARISAMRSRIDALQCEC